MADITPTETITGFGIIIGVVGSIGSILMSQRIKNKQQVPVGSLAVSAAVLVSAAVISVTIISKASK